MATLCALAATLVWTTGVVPVGAMEASGGSPLPAGSATALFARHAGHRSASASIERQVRKQDDGPDEGSRQVVQLRMRLPDAYFLQLREARSDDGDGELFLSDGRSRWHVEFYDGRAVRTTPKRVDEDDPFRDLARLLTCDQALIERDFRWSLLSLAPGAGLAPMVVQELLLEPVTPAMSGRMRWARLQFDAAGEPVAVLWLDHDGDLNIHRITALAWNVELPDALFHWGQP
jgi:hypothetical protein